MRARIRELWLALFLNERPARCELLLFLLLVNVLHDGIVAFTQPLSVFLENDAFSPVSLGIEPRGWVAWLPDTWVLSHTLYQGVGLVALLSSLLWIFKRLLPWAAVVCALAHGLQISMEESLMFNYKHQALPGVALLVLYAGMYTVRHASFSDALRARRFWSSDVYPQWVYVLLLTYLGLLYSSAGMIKLFFAGMDSVRGLPLQLLLLDTSTTYDVETLSWFAQPLVRYRVVATIAMFMTVVLETGAIVAFMIPRLRMWWAIGLILMHTHIWIAMHIPFKIHIALLVWLALPLEKWVEALGASVRNRGWTVGLSEKGIVWRNICGLVYAVDVLGILSPVASREYASK